MRVIGVAAVVLLSIAGAAAEKAPGPTAVRQATSELLRVEAVASSVEDKAKALVTLCDLFAAIRVHPMYAQSEILRGEATRVRRRLLTAGRQIADRLDRAHTARPAEIAGRVDAALASIEPTGSTSPGDPPEPTVGAAGPGAVSDGGWELVELIERTVHPDFWENTGGPGSIRYFAIKRVLVVRATTEVHEDLAALLRQLSP